MANQSEIPITSTTQALIAAIEADPQNTLLPDIFGDAVEDADGNREEAAKAAEQIRLKKLAQIEIAAENARDKLARANGRRRTRLICDSRLLYCVVECLRSASGNYWLAGDTVANKYGYPSRRTAVVVARRSDGTCRIECGEVTASKGSSPTNQIAGLTVRATAADWLAWANASPRKES